MKPNRFGVRISAVTSALVIVSLVAGFIVAVAPSNPAGAQRVMLENFTSPSRNIFCLMSLDENGASADCAVAKPTWAKLKAKPKDCDLDWDPAEIFLSVEGSQTTIVEGGCRGDIGPYCGDECPKLAYGTSKKLGNIQCTSQQQGIRCQTTTGKRKGFLIAARSWKKL